MYYQVEIEELATIYQGGLLMSTKKVNKYHTKKIYLHETHDFTRNSNIAELMQCIYNAIFTVAYKASLQRKNKPGINCTWISDLFVDNEKQISQSIYHMDSFPQGRKKFNPLCSINKNQKTKKLNITGLI